MLICMLDLILSHFEHYATEKTFSSPVVRGVIISEVRVPTTEVRGYPEKLRFFSAFGVTGWIASHLGIHLVTPKALEVLNFCRVCSINL